MANIKKRIPWNKGLKGKQTAWNKGIPNTWYNPIGLEAGWKAKKELLNKRIHKVCEREGCNNQFSVPKSLNRVRYCSYSCGKLGKPSWRKGMTKYSNKTTKYLDDRRQRVLFRQIMQRQVFERDEYTCQMCNVRGIDLQVDHIQPWAEYVEGRFSIDNCRTLCARCHYKLTFGKEMPSNIKGW